MSFCLFVSKTSEAVGPNFFVGPHVNDKNFKNLCLKDFDRKNIMKSANLKKKFILYKEKMLTDKATIKSLNLRIFFITGGKVVRM